MTDHSIEGAGRALTELAPYERAVITALNLSTELTAALAAMGVERGQSVVLLRAGALGGPVHIRLHWATEIAIDRAIADAIRVSQSAPTEPSL